MESVRHADPNILVGEAMETNINERIAQRVRTLRSDRGMTLDGLAELSGVSRSTISLIERGESSPTAAVLDKLAAGLGVTLSALFEAPDPNPDPVSRHGDQIIWRDPASGYIRRNISPSGFPSSIQLTEVVFPAGAHVAYENTGRSGHVHQQIWVLDGAIAATVGDQVFQLGSGDCLACTLDQPTAFHNPTQADARYAVVVVSAPK